MAAGPGALRSRSTTTTAKPTAPAGRARVSKRLRPVHRHEPVPAGGRRRSDDRDPGAVLAQRPQRPGEQHPGGDLHHLQHRRRQHVQRPDLRQPRLDRHRRHHGPDRRPGPGGRQRDAADNGVNATYGFGTSMGLAVYAGQLYPVWAGNFDEATIVNGALAGSALSIYSRPMVIAAGPRVVNSTMGPIPLSPRPRAARSASRSPSTGRSIRPAPAHPSPPPTSRSSTTTPPTATRRSRSIS